MDSSLVALLALTMTVVGLVGTILPVLPGLIISFCGVLIYKYGGGGDISMFYIVLFGILTAISAVLNYVIPLKTTKKYGGSRYGSIGGFIGTIVGIFFIPIPFGFLVGMFAGVFIGELMHDRNDRKKAFNATKGALIGFIYGTGFNFLVGLAMFLVVLIDIIKSYEF